MTRRLASKSFPIGIFAALSLSGAALADPPDYSAYLLGDLNGFRPAFKKIGGTLNLTETSEIFANPVGGLRRGADYDGLSTLTIQLESEPGLGFAGGLFNASFVQLHGDNFTTRDIGALQTISGVQDDRATRLWELWWNQKLGDVFDVRVGQQSLDVEWANNPSAGLFINSLFGWPALHALDMPGGGPAFPLSALGVRLRAQSGPWTAQVGVFSGAPAPNTDPDPQHANRYGLSFPWRGALAMAEAQFASGQGEGEYAGLYKLGAWANTLSFADLQTNIAGQPLADPAADPTPRAHRGDFGFYAVGEQVVWRGAEKERTLTLFLRPQVAPQGDRNLVSFALNAGLVLRDPLPGRKDDSLALGFGYVRLSPAAIGFSRDTAAFNPGTFAPRSYEAVFEASYQVQLTPYAQVQPSLQYVRNPGAGLPDPAAPARRIGDAVIGGLRLNVTF